MTVAEPHPDRRGSRASEPHPDRQERQVRKRLEQATSRPHPRSLCNGIWSLREPHPVFGRARMWTRGFWSAERALG